MKITPKIILLIAFCLSKLAMSQMTVTPTNNALTLSQYIAGPGLSISNAIANCGANQAGTFSNGSAGFGLSSGIVLTSGGANGIIGGGFGTGNGAANFPPLTAISILNGGSPSLYDLCALTFDVTPICNYLEINFIFGSTEYPTFVNTAYNDVFGFFVNGPNPLGGNFVNHNIALLNGTNTPITITTIGLIPGAFNTVAGMTPNYYFTVPMIASLNVIPNATYTFTLAVADAGDGSLDTAVLLDYQGLYCPNPINLAYSAPEICIGDSVLLWAQGGDTSGFVWSNNPDLTFISNDSAWAKPTVTSTYHIISYTPWGPLSDTVTIVVNNLPDIELVSTDESCVGSSDGTASVVINSGGPTPHYYYWYTYPAQVLQTAQNLSEGWKKVRFTNGKGCRVFDSVYVNAAPPFDFDFNKSDNQCLKGNDFQFNGYGSQTNGITYNWNFGDNALNFFGDSVSHIYSQSGQYDVTLTVSNLSGCTDTIIKQVTVYSQPEVNFNFQNACFQQQVAFFDQSTVTNPDTTESIVAWQWLFGDGSRSENPNPLHYYANVGQNNATLIVTTAFGCIDSMTKTVETFTLPIAKFVGNETCENSANSFYDQSTISSGEITNWYWNFGTGTNQGQAFVQNPQYIFTNSGTFGVYLIVESDKGCKDSVYNSITVNPLPELGFSYFNTKGCGPLTVQLIDTISINSGSINNILWDFGDGNSSSNSMPTHTYLNSGNYSISINATSDKGCSSQFSIPNIVNVFPTPVADFTSDPSMTLITESMVYFDNLSNDATIFNWTIFDQNPYFTSTNENISYTFGNVGTFAVQLIASNSYGCVDTIVKSVYIDSDYTFYIPNSFTPNGDGFNDIFQPLGEGIQNFNMKIFDRWGGLVFESKDINTGWSGFQEDKSDYLKESVYIYKINIFDKYGKSHEYQGYITVIR